jgi:hypothetical protein
MYSEAGLMLDTEVFVLGPQVENLSQKNKNVNKLPKVKFERKKMI